MRKQFKVVDTADIGQAYHWKGDYEDFLTWYEEVKDFRESDFKLDKENNILSVKECRVDFPMSEKASIGDYIVKYPTTYLMVYTKEEFEKQLLILE